MWLVRAVVEFCTAVSLLVCRHARFRISKAFRPTYFANIRKPNWLVIIIFLVAIIIIIIIVFYVYFVIIIINEFTIIFIITSSPLYLFYDIYHTRMIISEISKHSSKPWKQQRNTERNTN